MCALCYSALNGQGTTTGAVDRIGFQHVVHSASSHTTATPCLLCSHGARTQNIEDVFVREGRNEPSNLPYLLTGEDRGLCESGPGVVSSSWALACVEAFAQSCSDAVAGFGCGGFAVIFCTPPCFKPVSSSSAMTLLVSHTDISTHHNVLCPPPCSPGACVRHQQPKRARSHPPCQCTRLLWPQLRQHSSNPCCSWRVHIRTWSSS